MKADIKSIIFMSRKSRKISCKEEKREYSRVFSLKAIPNKDRDKWFSTMCKKLHNFTLSLNRRKIFITCQILDHVSRTTGVNWLILPVTICFTKGLSHARFSLKRQ